MIFTHTGYASIAREMEGIDTIPQMKTDTPLVSSGVNHVREPAIGLPLNGYLGKYTIG